MADFLCLPLLRKAVFTAEVAARSHCQWCPPLALSGHSIMSHLMSLSGVKRTWCFAAHMSAFDPKRTSVPYGRLALTVAPFKPSLNASVVTAFLHWWVEIPKCNNHRLGLFVGSDVRDGAGCRLTVHRLNTVALGGEPIVYL